jgi:hypothetical protein
MIVQSEYYEYADCVLSEIENFIEDNTGHTDFSDLNLEDYDKLKKLIHNKIVELYDVKVEMK